MLLGQPDYHARKDRSLLSAAAVVGIVIASLNGLMYVLAIMGAVGSALLRGR